jgi:hypothetical protein
MAKSSNASASSEASGEHSFSRTAVSEWHSRFKAGRVSVEGDKRSERPRTRKMTEDVEKIQELIKEDNRRTIHELVDTVGINYAICQEILT